jgi:acyl-CoA reductase-like NAD-dependent aldehyde dehydrogenase
MFMQDNMTIAQDEIFGPVMALMKFKYIYASSLNILSV